MIKDIVKLQEPQCGNFR